MAKAPPLVVGNAALLRLGFATNTSTAMINVLGCIQTSGNVIFNQALANALGAAIKSSWTTNMAPRCATTTALNFVGIRNIAVASQPEFVDTGASVPGTGVGEPLPGGSACVVSLKTALAGPRHRGRVYLGGFTETENVSPGVISPAAQTACQNFVTAVDTNLGTNGMRLAVVSRPAFSHTFTVSFTDNLGNVNTTTHTRPARPGEVNQVVGIAVRNNLWDEQRRRNATGSQSTRSLTPTIFLELAR